MPPGFVLREWDETKFDGTSSLGSARSAASSWATLGVTRDFGRHWALGLELRDHNELREYREWENTAVFLGPAINYRQEKWWATLSFLPQVYGANFGGDPDGHRNLELEGHERVNIRLIFGISF